MQVTFNTRLEYELSQRLEEHAKETSKSKAAIVAVALEEYLNKMEVKKND